MRTVYLGTSEFAAGVLERLAGGPHRPALVVTRPDRPKGRGRRTQAPPVAVRAQALGVECIQPEELHDPEVVARIEAAEPDVLIVCAYGVLVREPLLSLREILNVHPSLLPRWRGAAPIERAIMAGDAETGVSIMRLTEGLDSGPVCARATEPIHADDDYGTLAARLEILGGDLLVRALDERPPYAEQPAEGVTYAEKVEAPDRSLDPAQPPEAVARVVRALQPHIGARLALPGEAGFLGVVAAHPAEPGPGAPAGGRLRALPGPPARLLLDCLGGALELTRVQPPGGKPMAAGDWLRGRPLVDVRVDPSRPGGSAGALAERAIETWDPEAEWAPEIEALARRADAEVLDLLRALAADPRPAARSVAATVLGQFGVPVAVVPAASSGVLERMAEAESAHGVLAAIACAFGHLGEPYGTATLVGLRRHPDAEVRDAVAFALLGRRDPRALEALTELAEGDPDPRIRELAGLEGS